MLAPSVRSIMNIWRSGRWLLLLLMLCISIYALSDFVVASNLIGSLPCSRSNWVLCPPWGVNYRWWPGKSCLSKRQLDWVWVVFLCKYRVWALLRLFHEYILKQYYYHYSFQCWWIVAEYLSVKEKKTIIILVIVGFRDSIKERSVTVTGQLNIKFKYFISRLRPFETRRVVLKSSTWFQTKLLFWKLIWRTFLHSCNKFVDFLLSLQS